MKGSRLEVIDFIRGMAIIAVVVCHQQYIIHKSEYIQFLTLYSVTTLIFLLGVTKGFSLKKYISLENNKSILLWTFSKMSPVLLSYVFASIATDCYAQNDKVTMFNNLITFTAEGTFYFIEYYIKLSLLAPFLFYILISIFKLGNKHIIIGILILFFIVLWVVGYWSYSSFNIFGASYLFVYGVGLCSSLIKWPIVNIKFINISLLVLLFGTYSAWRFYFARVSGVLDYDDFIDAIAPKYQLNPANISLIVYSFGVILFLYCFYELFNKIKIINLVVWIVIILGKYSLDIFLYHMFILKILNIYIGQILDGIIILKGIVYYCLMFGLPIVGRRCWNYIKMSMYDIQIVDLR